MATLPIAGHLISCASIGYECWNIVTYLPFSSSPIKYISNGSLRDFGITAKFSVPYTAQEFALYTPSLSVFPSSQFWSTGQYGQKSISITSNCAWRLYSFSTAECENLILDDVNGDILINDSLGDKAEVWGGNGHIYVTRNSPGTCSATAQFYYGVNGSDVLVTATFSCI